MIKKILACALFAFVIFANIYPLAGKPQEQIDCQITIDRISVPDLYFKNLTLLIQVNDATNFTLTAGVDPVPFAQVGDQLVATTTEDDLNLNLTTGSNLGGLCDVEKAHLLADKRWAWSHGFDDNVDLHDAIDEFRAKSWPATLFNIAKDYDQTRNESWIVDEPYVNTVLLPEGWVLGNHSWSHEQFTQTVPAIDGYREDIVAAQTRFEEGIARSSTPGLQVMVFASPNFSAAYDEPFAELTATTDLKLMENGNDYMLTVTDAEPFTSGTQTAQPLAGRTTIGRDPRIEWSTIPVIAAMDWMATHSTADRRFWYNTLSHGNHEVNIKTVIDHVSANYGAEGTDEVWVTSSSEIYSYILTRDNATLSVVKPSSIPTVTPTLPPHTETPTATPVTPTTTATVIFTPTLTATSVVGTITMTPTSIPVTPTNTPTVGIPTSTPIPTATTVGTLGCQITVDRSAVPDLSFQNLTLLIQVNDAMNIALTAGGSEVPFVQVGNRLIATTAHSELYLNFSQGNQLGGLCEVEKAPLLNDKQWAWSHGFDDNVGLRNGINEFRAKSWPATLFNIAIDYDQTRDESWIVDEPYVNNVLIPEGWVLGNHSWNNEWFDTANPTAEDYRKDILDAQTRLEAGISRSSNPDLQVMVFAAPNSSIEYDDPFNELTATTDLKLMESGNDYLLTLTDDVAFTADGRTAMSFTGRTKIGRDLRIAWSADDAIAEIDWMANYSTGAQRFWYNSYAKGDSEVSIKAVLDHVWDNYGPDGTDEAWVTSSSEIYSYLLTRDNAVIRVVKPSIIPTSTPQPTPSSTPTMVSTETSDVLTPTPDGTPAVNVSPTPTLGDQRFFYLPLIVR